MATDRAPSVDDREWLLRVYLLSSLTLSEPSASENPRMDVSRDHELIAESSLRWLRRRVAGWFREHGREFPWRETDDPYRVLIAELLLQRTRADLVEPLYHRFLASYPSAHALAKAEAAQTEELLRPLGFLHRSRRLPGLGQALV